MMNGSTLGLYIKRIDRSAAELYPDDAPRGYVPLVLAGDGNCLFRAAIVCYEEHHKELRSLAMNKMKQHSESYVVQFLERSQRTAEKDASYLSRTSLLSQALSDHASRIFFSSLREQNMSLLEAFANAVKEENIAGTKNCMWAGMFEIAALASVLHCMVRSVYPNEYIYSCRSYMDTTFSLLHMLTFLTFKVISYITCHFIVLLKTGYVRPW
jgi:hypothetical protein